MGVEGAQDGARRRGDPGTPDAPLSGDALAEATVEMTRLLGSTDTALRSRAVHRLTSWVTTGAHDDLLSALGHGMAAGLTTGLGSHGDAGVLRRAGSAQVLAAVVLRGTERDSLPADDVLTWADQVFTWLVRERDSHSTLLLPGPGAVGQGATALAALAGSPHLDAAGLTVLLDVVADRTLLPVPRLASADSDLLARAVVAVVARDLVPLTVLEPWVRRMGTAALPARPSRAPVTPGPVQSASDVLRAIQLRLVLGTERPTDRVDLLLVLSDAVRGSAPDLFDA